MIKINKSKQGKRKEFICKVCGQNFESYYPNAKYCNRSCYDKDVKLERKQCPVCAKLFKPTWSGQIHCNINCYAKSESLKDNAKNSLLIKYNSIAKWRGGTNTKSFENSGQFAKGHKPWNYAGDDEFRQLTTKIRRCKKYFDWRKRVLERDGSKKKNLHVHHLISFRELLIKNKITSIEDAENCESLWDLDIGITLTKGEHKVITELERMKDITVGFLVAFNHVMREKGVNNL